MNVLLTGAGGYIGSALLRAWLPRLAELDIAPRALYRHRAPPAMPGVEQVVGDLRDAATCERVCAGQDVILHLAGQAHVSGQGVDHERDTLGITLSLAEAAVHQGVGRFIFVSSSKAQFPRHSAYGRAKREAEERLLAMHAEGRLAVTCLRPALVYGPGMHGNLRTLLRVLQRRWLPAVPASSSPLGMLSLADCCRALTLALQTPALDGACWELNDGQQYNLDLLVREVRRRCALPAPVLRLPRFSVQWAAGLWGLVGPAGSSFSSTTYRALYEEPYRLDDRFAVATGFQAEQSFQTALPALLKELQQ